MINQDQALWIVSHCKLNPEFIINRVVPAMNERISRAERERDRAIREAKTLDQVKYAQGWLDGVHDVTVALFSGMMAAEAKKPIASGLMSRILGDGSRRQQVPAGPGESP